MTLRRKAAIVGMGELPTRRTYPGGTTTSLCTEAARMAIADAGLRKEDVDGLITRGSDVSPMDLAEYMGLHVGFCEGVTQHGSSGALAVVAATAAIHAGLAHTILCVFGGTRAPAVRGFGPGVVRGMPPASKGSAFEAPFGPAPRANMAMS
jgi:3-oxoacyl-[acyl-carrier-protein] synthase III